MKYTNCSFCGGKVVEENIDAEFWWGENLVAFENVPAGVCEKCGEQYFNADVYQKMVELAESKTKPERVVIVPVWNLANAHTG